MSGDAKWSDLAARLGSAIAMVAVGALGLWFGGHVFHLLIVIICALMVWELVRMQAPDDAPDAAPDNGRLAVQLAVLSGFALLIAVHLPSGFVLPMLLAPVFASLNWVKKHRAIYLIFAILVLLAGFSMVTVRDDFGAVWMLWLICVVVATDVLGYFAGRMIGGPKFWPAVSPKKTWSGTGFGWLAAALVGWGFACYTGSSLNLIWISIALSMASQAGDVGESAIKRRFGVKDSSDLIPGHGGVLDRFDGMLGAAVFLLILIQIIGFPAGAL